MCEYCDISFYEVDNREDFGITFLNHKPINIRKKGRRVKAIKGNDKMYLREAKDAALWDLVFEKDNGEKIFTPARYCFKCGRKLLGTYSEV